MKWCLINMEHNNLADRSLPHHLFAISAVCLPIAHYGSQVALASWNAHCIPGKLSILFLFLSIISGFEGFIPTARHFPCARDNLPYLFYQICDVSTVSQSSTFYLLFCRRRQTEDTTLVAGQKCHTY